MFHEEFDRSTHNSFFSGPSIQPSYTTSTHGHQHHQPGPQQYNSTNNNPHRLNHTRLPPIQTQLGLPPPLPAKPTTTRTVTGATTAALTTAMAPPPTKTITTIQPPQTIPPPPLLSPMTPRSSTTSPDSYFAKAVIDHHNARRAKYGQPPVASGSGMGSGGGGNTLAELVMAQAQGTSAFGAGGAGTGVAEPLSRAMHLQHILGGGAPVKTNTSSAVGNVGSSGVGVVSERDRERREKSKERHRSKREKEKGKEKEKTRDKEKDRERKERRSHRDKDGKEKEKEKDKDKSGSSKKHHHHREHKDKEKKRDKRSKSTHRHDLDEHEDPPVPPPEVMALLQTQPPPPQPPAVPDKLALGSGPLHPALNPNSPHNLTLHPPGGILATSTPVDGLGMPFDDHSSMYTGGSGVVVGHGDVTLGVDGVTTIAGDVMHHEDEDDDDHHYHDDDDDDDDPHDEDEDRGRTPTPTSAHPFPPTSFAGGSYAAYQHPQGQGHVGAFVESPEKMGSREGSSRAAVNGGGGGANGINAHANGTTNGNGIVGVDGRKGSLPAYSALDPYAAFPTTSVPQAHPHPGDMDKGYGHGYSGQPPLSDTAKPHSHSNSKTKPRAHSHSHPASRTSSTETTSSTNSSESTSGYGQPVTATSFSRTLTQPDTHDDHDGEEGEDSSSFIGSGADDLRHLRRAQGDRDRGGPDMDWMEGGGLVNPASPQNAGMGGAIPNGRGSGEGGGGSASRRVSRIPPELDNTRPGLNGHHQYLSPHHLSPQHLSPQHLSPPPVASGSGQQSRGHQTPTPTSALSPHTPNNPVSDTNWPSSRLSALLKVPSQTLVQLLQRAESESLLYKQKYTEATAELALSRLDVGKLEGKVKEAKEKERMLDEREKERAKENRKREKEVERAKERVRESEKKVQDTERRASEAISQTNSRAQERIGKLEKEKMDQGTKLTNSIMELQTQAGSAQAALRTAQIKLQHTSGELDKTRGIIRTLENTNEALEKSNRDTREQARRMKAQLASALAKEEGRREGWEEGMRQGRVMAETLAGGKEVLPMLLNGQKRLVGDGTAYIEEVTSPTGGEDRERGIHDDRDRDRRKSSKKKDKGKAREDASRDSSALSEQLEKEREANMTLLNRLQSLESQIAEERQRRADVERSRSSDLGGMMGRMQELEGLLKEKEQERERESRARQREKELAEERERQLERERQADRERLLDRERKEAEAKERAERERVEREKDLEREREFERRRADLEREKEKLRLDAERAEQARKHDEETQRLLALQSAKEKQLEERLSKATEEERKKLREEAEKEKKALLEQLEKEKEEKEKLEKELVVARTPLMPPPSTLVYVPMPVPPTLNPPSASTSAHPLPPQHPPSSSAGSYGTSASRTVKRDRLRSRRREKEREREDDSDTASVLDIRNFPSYGGRAPPHGGLGRIMEMPSPRMGGGYGGMPEPVTMPEVPAWVERPPPDYSNPTSNYLSGGRPDLRKMASASSGSTYDIRVVPPSRTSSTSPYDNPHHQQQQHQNPYLNPISGPYDRHPSPAPDPNAQGWVPTRPSSPASSAPGWGNIDPNALPPGFVPHSVTPTPTAPNFGHPPGGPMMPTPIVDGRPVKKKDKERRLRDVLSPPSTMAPNAGMTMPQPTSSVDYTRAGAGMPQAGSSTFDYSRAGQGMPQAGSSTLDYNRAGAGMPEPGVPNIVAPPVRPPSSLGGGAPVSMPEPSVPLYPGVPRAPTGGSTGTRTPATSRHTPGTGSIGTGPLGGAGGFSMPEPTVPNIIPRAGSRAGSRAGTSSGMTPAGGVTMPEPTVPSIVPPATTRTPAMGTMSMPEPTVPSIVPETGGRTKKVGKKSKRNGLGADPAPSSTLTMPEPHIPSFSPSGGGALSMPEPNVVDFTRAGGPNRPHSSTPQPDFPPVIPTMPGGMMGDGSPMTMPRPEIVDYTGGTGARTPAGGNSKLTMPQPSVVDYTGSSRTPARSPAVLPSSLGGIGMPTPTVSGIPLENSGPPVIPGVTSSLGGRSGSDHHGEEPFIPPMDVLNRAEAVEASERGGGGGGGGIFNGVTSVFGGGGGWGGWGSSSNNNNANSGDDDGDDDGFGGGGGGFIPPSMRDNNDDDDDMDSTTLRNTKMNAQMGYGVPEPAVAKGGKKKKTGKRK